MGICWTMVALVLAAPAKPAPSPLATALQRVAAIFPADGWNVDQYPWRPVMVHQAAELVGARTRAENATQGWRDGQVLYVSTVAAPPRTVGIGAVRLASADAARGYFGLQIDLRRLMDQQLQQPVKQNQSQSIKVRGAEEAVRIDRELIVGPDSAAMVHETTLLMRNGDLVVEFLWSGLPADLAWAEAVFSHLRRAR